MVNGGAIMLYSHCPFNDSSSYLNNTAYPAFMLEAFWHTQEVTKSQKVHIKSWWIAKLYNINLT